MPTLGLIGLILCSAIVTLDGTAVTVALTDIASSLNARFSTLQWITNAPLLMIAGLVIPAGALGDKYERRRLMVAGLAVFGAASLACAVASSGATLLICRFIQGAGAALLVPGTIAILRATYRDELERTRAFGLVAAWTGIASAVGPVLGGAVVDTWSWRGVFILSAAMIVPALLLLRAVPKSAAEFREPLSPVATLLILILLVSLSYGLIEGGNGKWAPPVLAAFCIAAGATFALTRHDRVHSLIPRELSCSRNCVAANVVTAALYFALFGLSFLLVMYTQAVLGYSATWAGISVLPVAIVMMASDRCGRLATKTGSRVLIMAGVIVSSAGILWLASGPDRLPFGSHIVPGTALFGLGLAMAVGPLTHAAVSSVPAKHAGAASGVHHAAVRASGLVAIALLGSIAAGAGRSETLTLDGLRAALIVCGGVVLVPGLLVGRWITDDAKGGLEKAA